MTELGIIDTITKVSLLSSHLALPREGHLKAAVHVIGYIGQKYSSRLVYDPTYPDIDHSVFKKCDCTELHRDAKEAILIYAPKPREKGNCLMSMYSDHAVDKVSCGK